MTSEPKAMREIHEIRLKNYEAEKELTHDELEGKRNGDVLRVNELIKKYGLKVRGNTFKET